MFANSIKFCWFDTTRGHTCTNFGHGTPNRSCSSLTSRHGRFDSVLWFGVGDFGNSTLRRRFRSFRPPMGELVGLSGDLWKLFLGGDADALAVLFDVFEDEGMSLLRVGVTYYINTPTWVFVGEVVETNHFGVTLKEGCWRIGHVGDEETFLATGKFAERDEASQCSGRKFIPLLWVGPSEEVCPDFLAQMRKWKRTHEPSPLMAGQEDEAQ